MWVARNVLVAVLAVVVLQCIGHARGFAYVPITSVFYGGTSAGTAAEDSSICLTKGGYLATEATAVLHETDIATIRAAIGSTTTFYAYLGGGINTVLNNTGGYAGFCPWGRSDPELPASIASATSGSMLDCLYRWRVGRWQLTTSDAGADVDQAHAGVTFYQGQNSLAGATFGFPTWFYQVMPLMRPGIIQGRYVVLFQNSETTTAGMEPRWTDNFGLGGYTYANYVRGFNAAVSAATVSSFVAVCQAQGPFRLNYEDPRASTPQRSELQYVWWVIFLVILFVLCLIAYIIIACCQEREDMDEPPEDAPEWAEQETEERNVSKRYVSQRSFHGAVQSPTNSTHSSDRDSRSSNPSKEDKYSDNEEQA